MKSSVLRGNLGVKVGQYSSFTVKVLVADKHISGIAFCRTSTSKAAWAFYVFLVTGRDGSV
jgi:hypothetical protein